MINLKAFRKRVDREVEAEGRFKSRYFGTMNPGRKRPPLQWIKKKSRLFPKGNRSLDPQGRVLGPKIPTRKPSDGEVRG